MKRINQRLAAAAAALLFCSALAAAQSGATRPRRVTPVQPTPDAAASVSATPAGSRTGAAVGTGSVAHAFSLLEQKQYEAALAEAKQLAAADPKNSEAWKIAGYAQFYLKRYAEAAADLERALDLRASAGDKDTKTEDALAQAYFFAEKYEQALPLLVAATTRAGVKPDANTLYYRAVAEMNLKKTADAERTFGEVLKADPKNKFALLYIGQLAFGRQDYATAVNMLNRATLADPTFAQGWERVYREDPADSLYRAAREALNRGDYKRAAAMFRDVERKYPQSQYVADAMYYQAFALSRTGNERDLRTALDVLKEQQRRFPDAPSGTDAGTLAVRIQGVLAHRGDPEAMKKLLEAAGTGSGSGAGSGGGSAAGGAGIGAGRGGRAGSSSCPSEDDDDDIRMAALNALLQMDSERAIPILKQVLAKRDECSVALRRKAVFLVAQKQSDESATILLDAARNDPDVEVRRQAVFWLSEVHSDRALNALDSILNGSKDEEVQEKALFALSNTNTARGTEILRTYAQSNAPEELRAKAVFWLGQSSRRSSDNTAFLQSLFDKTTSEEIQNAVIQAMSEAPGEEGARWMLGVVQNTKQPVETRKKALFWAGQRRGIDINTLLALYPKLDDQELKEHFIFVLSERREAAATDKLIEIAKSDKDVEMRKKALFWLAQKNDPRAKQLLMEIINQ